MLRLKSIEKWTILIKKSGNPGKSGKITRKKSGNDLGRLKYILYLTKNMMRMKNIEKWKILRKNPEIRKNPGK